MKIWVFPIEPFELRYTAQWKEWFTGPRFAAHGDYDVRSVNGVALTDGIESGQWLDVLGTHHYKATQLAAFVRYLKEGMVEDGDVVLLLDAWSPAAISLAYMRDTGDVKFRMVGLLHAGTWDPHDFLSQRKLTPWARYFEHGALKACDALCVATHFHAGLLRAAFGDELSVHVTGFPFYTDGFDSAAVPWEQRGRLVVFPHRLAPEKQPHVFDEIAERYRRRYGNDGAEFVRTRDVYTTKAEYYRLLGRSRVVVSAALQETWGIAMLEGVSLGAWPVAPDALSYPETLSSDQLYTDLDKAVVLVRRGLEATACYAPEPHHRRSWGTAMQYIAAICEGADRAPNRVSV